MYKYYITSKLDIKYIKKELHNLHKGPFILKFPINNKLSNWLGFEGPYYSLEMLKLYSEVFKRIFLKDIFLAKKISTVENIHLVKEIINCPDYLMKDEMITDALIHIRQGHFNKNNPVGGHYLNDQLRIKNVSKIDMNGIIEAEIELFDPYEHLWKSKKGISTLFPLNWDLHKIHYEIYYAFNFINLEKNINKYISRTSNGIEVVFIIKNNKIKTIYPLVKL